ncbi:MAG: glycoside hydrolase family 5 protein [Candidatus Omnitrophota bacterium]|jgi:aryl-phospho-beta-D-glucosidase BglC (GH1 family)
MAAKLPFLHVDKTDIVDESGKPIFLKGVALGGWLMMEGYMMCGRNIPEKAFKEGLERSAGKEACNEFTRAWRDTFIRESDIKIIKGWGANCVRIPFNYRLAEFEDKPFSLNEEGLAYLDRAVEWCQKHALYCILDMHAVPGAQNPDWHSDCTGEPEFFKDQFNQDRFLRLWHFLADHYSGVSNIAGYDVLNEPVLKLHQDGMIKDVYDKVTKEIRDVDQKHIIFLEGSNWGSRISFLGTPQDKNTAYSIHTYAPPDFTFNWIVDMTYPGRAYNVMWDKKTLEIFAKQYTEFTNKHEVPLYIGEFGVNYRDGHYGELNWVKDMLNIFEKRQFHWTYWTYKTVANSVFPDGIYRYIQNPPWINRKGPVTGWENFYTMWTKERGKIISSWKTENFERNDKLLQMLKNHY